VARLGVARVRGARNFEMGLSGNRNVISLTLPANFPSRQPLVSVVFLRNHMGSGGPDQQ
jgi:hypothetical protein